MLAIVARAADAVLPASNRRVQTRQQRRGAQLRVLAVAAPQSSTMKVYKAASMDGKQLEEFTARPRIDFSSILGTVGQRQLLC
jgi:hypothetical protein